MRELIKTVTSLEYNEGVCVRVNDNSVQTIVVHSTHTNEDGETIYRNGYYTSDLGKAMSEYHERVNGLMYKVTAVEKSNAKVEYYYRIHYVDEDKSSVVVSLCNRCKQYLDVAGVHNGMLIDFIETWELVENTEQFGVVCENC